MHVALIVPVKSFAIAKGRLATTLTAPQRAQIAQQCAEQVVQAATPWPVYVVCNDDAVAHWAISVGASVVRCDEPGIDAAVRAGRQRAASDGAEHVVIAHSDLPLATHFDHLPLADTITFVPDRHRDGTNVIALPTRSTFTTSYGPQSFSRHVASAERMHLAFRVIDDSDLALDLDTADDLSELQRRNTNSTDEKTLS